MFSSYFIADFHMSKIRAEENLLGNKIVRKTLGCYYVNMRHKSLVLKALKITR